MNPYKAEMYKSWRRRNAPYLIAICLAMVVVLLGAPEVHDGKGMEPTLREGDVVIVSKHDYSQKRGIPERERVVILEKARSLDAADDNIIARVIALPGETVEIKNGEVLVNGKTYVTEKGVSGASGRDMKVKLKDSEVFVLGDNREADGPDSRNSKLGPVNMKDDIKGNVLLRVWPLKDFGRVK